MATIQRSAQLGAEHRFVLYSVPWETYELLRDARGLERVRMTYDRGTLELMTPSQRHESVNSLLGQLLVAFTNELQIPRRSLRSTTWKRHVMFKGLEPDECYYILNHPRIRDLQEINLEVDPPPDLAIEVEIRRGAIKRMALYAALGVPEVWRWHKNALKAYALQPDGSYREIEMSLNLPMLRVKDLEPFLDPKLTADESQWSRVFRQWVQERFGA
ncbi:MAG TPA: Uma2 family endonuclease [Pirellulales bacterium]|nr:Uma2 family endonuclease [Pirellulales bacterium]